ncbi:MAG: hypothetical protein OHK0029_26630 [Armatimonadaceae bacterium]
MADCDLTIAGNVVRNVEVGFLNDSGSNDVPGVLGMDVLSQFVVLLDFPARKVFLKKP